MLKFFIFLFLLDYVIKVYAYLHCERGNGRFFEGTVFMLFLMKKNTLSYKVLLSVFWSRPSKVRCTEHVLWRLKLPTIVKIGAALAPFQINRRRGPSGPFKGERTEGYFFGSGRLCFPVHLLALNHKPVAARLAIACSDAGYIQPFGPGIHGNAVSFSVKM